MNSIATKTVFTLGQLESEWKFQRRTTLRAPAHVNPGPPPMACHFPSVLSFTGGYGFTYEVPVDEAMRLLDRGNHLIETSDEIGLIRMEGRFIQFAQEPRYQHIEAFKKAQRESNKHCMHAELSTSFWRKMRGEIYAMEGISSSQKLGIDEGDVGGLYGAIVHVFPDSRNTPDIKFVN